MEQKSVRDRETDSVERKLKRGRMEREGQGEGEKEREGGTEIFSNSAWRILSGWENIGSIPRWRIARTEVSRGLHGEGFRGAKD